MGKAPGKNWRKGMTLVEFFEQFPNDEAAEAWFIEQRWPDGVRCAHCESANVAERANREPRQWRCRDCRKDFSVRTDTVMHNTKKGHQTWLLAMYLMVTSLKGVSSLKLSRDLGVAYSTAWHLSHRLREAYTDGKNVLRFAGPVEVDETFFGGRAKNMHAKDRKRRISGRGGVDKAAVVGIKDRETGTVTAQPVPDTDAVTLVPYVTERTNADAVVFTDGHKGYNALPRTHEVVAHSAGEYVRGMAHTNGIESFWAMLKRGYVGTYHQLSTKHLHRYVNEFSGRHNQRPLDTADQMASTARRMGGKRLEYADLVADVPAGTLAEADRSEPW